MAEELDLSGAVDMLKNMLSREEGKAQIESIVSMLGGGAEAAEEKGQQSGIGNENIEMMLKLQKVMAVMNSGKNSRQTAFLQSLKDLLRPERRGTVDNAVKFLSVSRAVKAFKELEGV